MIHLPTSFRVASLALGQSYDCPSASEVTLKDVAKINKYYTTKHEPHAYLYNKFACYVDGLLQAYSISLALSYRYRDFFQGN